ncbi:XRE family transcriptional regulator [Lacticaseibacillus pantheris]|uniref:XRE family transcriptional regulator n=1 Tax=Lacticaseibacillus pantheris TaxID=171523 RepID=UPI002659B511|nr:XRE family transcriptional regulator [Lacticaseibacillus pantheris]WKF84454.1 XRE family transcriptional regulator [Lacticaseibacillus pantheris]
MTVQDNVVALWKEYRPDIKSIAELERNINLSNGIINQWSTSIPTTRSAQKVADFFGVPVSRVLSNGDDEAVKLSKQEQAILVAFRQNNVDLTDEQSDELAKSAGELLKAARGIIKNKNN